MTEWQAGCMGSSKLVLVDLAGSERAGRSGRSGQGGEVRLFIVVVLYLW